MKYNGVDFNSEWAKTKTEAEFVAEFNNGLTEKQLKEAYALCNPQEKKVVIKKSADDKKAD